MPGSNARITERTGPGRHGTVSLGALLQRVLTTQQLHRPSPLITVQLSEIVI
jgi:hypothetical protein